MRVESLDSMGANSAQGFGFVFGFDLRIFPTIAPISY